MSDDAPTSDDRDPAKVRSAAHVVLDGFTASDPAVRGGAMNAEAMELAFTRLLEIEAIELVYDEDEEELELDVSALMEGMLLVVRSLVGQVVDRTGQSPEDVVAATRSDLDRT